MQILWLALVMAAGLVMFAVAWLLVRLLDRDGGEPLSIHRPTADLDREINADHARSRDFFQF